MNAHSIGRHLTFANIASGLALVIAISGSGVAVAASLAPKNSVNSRAIINGQVKAKDLQNSSVSGSKVADNSLTGADIADGSVTGADINEGSLGTVPSASKATNVLRAAVNADGTLVSAQSDGAVSAGTTVDGAGTYEVIFNRVVTACTFVVASGEAGTTGGTSFAMVSETGRGGNPSGIYVTTRDGTGTKANRSFMVLGVC